MTSKTLNLDKTTKRLGLKMFRKCYEKQKKQCFLLTLITHITTSKLYEVSA